MMKIIVVTILFVNMMIILHLVIINVTVKMKTFMVHSLLLTNGTVFLVHPIH